MSDWSCVRLCFVPHCALRHFSHYYYRCRSVHLGVGVFNTGVSFGCEVEGAIYFRLEELSRYQSAAFLHLKLGMCFRHSYCPIFKIARSLLPNRHWKFFHYVLLYSTSEWCISTLSTAWNYNSCMQLRFINAI